MAVVRTFDVPVLRITPAPRWPPFSSGLWILVSWVERQTETDTDKQEKCGGRRVPSEIEEAEFETEKAFCSDGEVL